MHRIWSNQSLVFRIFEATRTPAPSIHDFLEPTELLGLDEEALSALEASYKVHRLQRLAAPDRDADFRHTLLQCMRVCKIFHGPAAELLWNKVPSFQAVIGLLPDDVKVKKFGHSTPVIKHRLPAGRAQRGSFLTHPRGSIRSIAYCERHEQTTPMTVSNVLDSHPFADQVLGNVDTVTWDVESHLHLYRVAPFLTSRLRSLEMRSKCASDFSSTPSQILRSVADNCFHLTSLSLTGSFVTPTTLPSFLGIATKLIHLTEFKILQSHEWHEFPTPDEMITSRPWPDDPHRPYFPSLEVVTLHGPAPYLSDILTAIHCFPRKRAQLRLTTVPSSPDVTRLLRCLGRCPVSVSHIEISMSKYPAFRVDATNRTVKGTAFRPLYRLSHLAHLELHQIGISIDLSEDDIHRMGVAWSRLHFLGLDTHPSHFDCPNWLPTLALASLPLFAEYPSLQVLKTPISVPDRQALAYLARTTSQSRSPLWGFNWDISNIDEDNEAIVMTYLRTVFRNLTVVKKCAGESWDVKKMVFRKGVKLVPATACRKWDTTPVIPIESRKWAYRSWCL